MAATQYAVGMLLWLYRLLFIPVLVLLAPAYLWRMRKRGGYGAHFAHRFGAHPPRADSGAQRVWLQAVSVGEMLAIGPLLEGLRAMGVDVYLTTTTSTGYKLARERYARLAAGIGYFPLDWWPFSAWAWNRIAPDLVIITEGERWPEHLHQARRHGVPVICINARMSDRSYARIKRFPGVARLMFGGVTQLLPGSAQDERRFLELGMPADRVRTTGNIKLDVQIPLLSGLERQRLRRELGLPEGPLLLGSSTWPGEEIALLATWQDARKAGALFNLLLVPRHAERRSEIERLLRDAGVRYHLRSQGAAVGEVDVAVGDTTGELRQFTQLADVVFVGKSLPPHTDGQTPVEAAALEKPILFGPGMGNFRELAADLVRRGAARIVHRPSELSAAARQLFANQAEREELAQAAGQWHRENAGAVGRTLEVIRAELPSAPGVRASIP